MLAHLGTLRTSLRQGRRWPAAVVRAADPLPIPRIPLPRTRRREAQPRSKTSRSSMVALSSMNTTGPNWGGWMP
jgi:hypothetical protein